MASDLNANPTIPSKWPLMNADPYNLSVYPITTDLAVIFPMLTSSIENLPETSPLP